ncbi:MAG: sigma 54-dependent Fis family transcriptional regulator [Polyangiaceae bacterium]|nr:sigma 54-dependent Fis family transcriptional regulator [Polyangiaceae bacterium]
MYRDESTRTADAGGKQTVALRTHKICIEVVRGSMAGRVVELAGPEVRIGSSSKCDFVLEDQTVSREHVILRIEGDRLRVVDAGSRNGTTVDGVVVRDADARPDSTIGLGTSAIRLKMTREMIELPISSRDHFGQLMGRSVVMRRVFTLLERIAPTDTTVLIEGETGTGKELAAAAIHVASSRARKPLVVFDCSAVSATLVESELFGHVKGAFTGAVRERVGKFEAAHGGTLFLDELGELPLDMQQKLLRALEARKVSRVGSNDPIPVDVRIIGATNRSLANEVERGRFREDLYYRLAVVPVRLPPLRERLDDVPMLVRHFEASFRKGECPPPSLSDDAIHEFLAETWPGNVRELRNRVELMLSLKLSEFPAAAQSAAQRFALPALGVDVDVPLDAALAHLKEAYEKAYVEEILKRHGYNVTRAAMAAGVGRAHMHRLMQRYGVHRDQPS